MQPPEQDTLDDDDRFLLEFLSRDEALAAIRMGRIMAHDIHSRFTFQGELHVVAVAAELLTLRTIARAELAAVTHAVVILRKHVADLTT